MQALQLDLLRSAARILPAGGKLLYSVCTTEPEETGQVAEIFNREHRDFFPEELTPLLPAPLQGKIGCEKAITLWPHRHNLDGFYIAFWRKKT